MTECVALGNHALIESQLQIAADGLHCGEAGRGNSLGVESGGDHKLGKERGSNGRAGEARRRALGRVILLLEATPAGVCRRISPKQGLAEPWRLPESE